MATFDQSITVKASPSIISVMLKGSLTANEQLIVVRPNVLLIVLRGGVGYVYLLRLEPDASTYLRLIIDTTFNVREAFRGKQPKEALTTLVASPATSDPLFRSLPAKAEQYLALIKVALEDRSGSLAIPPIASFDADAMPTTPPVAPVEEPEPTYSDTPYSSGTFTKKPLPGTGPDPYGNTASIFTKKPLPGPNTPSFTDKPKNPDELIRWVIFFAPLAGIRLGNNWGRLGKPQWTALTIALAILIPIFLVALLVAGVPRMADSPLRVPLAIILVVSNWVFIYSVYFLQRGAYKKWEQTGRIHDILDYHYNFVGVILGTLVLFLVLAGVGAFIAYSRSQPNTFNSSDVTITYPNMWAMQDTTPIPTCQKPTLQCVIVVTDAQYGSTSIFLIKVTVNAPVTPDLAEQRSWTSIQQQYPTASLESRSPTTIAGLPAYRRFYFIPNQKTPNDLDYGMQIYFVKGQTVYELTAESLNTGIFKEVRPNIDTFIAGIKIK